MAVTPAEISVFEFEGRTITNVRIHEVGTFELPDHLLRSAPLLRRSRDVVRISTGETPGTWDLEALGATVTAELLSRNVRLEIYPKFGFRGLATLLAWSSHGVTTLDTSGPVNVSEHETIAEIFAGEFLRSLQPVVSRGWVPRIVFRQFAAPDLTGRLDVVATIQRTYATGALNLVQDAGRLDFGAPANRVLVTALHSLRAIRTGLSERSFRLTRQLLADTEMVPPFRAPREALRIAEEIVRRRSVDPARSYFYAAIQAAIPILRAMGRSIIGSPELDDVPFRVAMPQTVESAVRNLTAHALGTHWIARKEGDRSLYRSADPETFNARLEPDIVVRPIADRQRVDVVIDVKYKEKPTASDHHQMAAYVSAYDAAVGVFATISDNRDERAVVGRSRDPHRIPIIEYAIPAHDVRRGLAEYAEWIRGLVNALRRAA
jgi:hypothetical protein